MARQLSKTREVEKKAAEMEEVIIRCDSLDEIYGKLEEVVELAREKADEYRDASSNWAGGNGNETFDEKADALEGYADALENWQFSDDPPEDKNDPDAHDEWLESARQEAIDFLNDFQW